MGYAKNHLGKSGVFCTFYIRTFEFMVKGHNEHIGQNILTIRQGYEAGHFAKKMGVACQCRSTEKKF